MSVSHSGSWVLGGGGGGGDSSSVGPSNVLTYIPQGILDKGPDRQCDGIHGLFE